MRTGIFVGALLGLIALCGCQSPEPAATPAPVSPNAPADVQNMARQQQQAGNTMASKAAAAAAAEKAARAKAGQ